MEFEFKGWKRAFWLIYGPVFLFLWVWVRIRAKLISCRSQSKKETCDLSVRGHLTMDLPLKYPRTLHWPWSPTIHANDSVHDDPHFFVGKRVIVTEKIDGSNTCLKGGEVYARSVSAPSHNGWFAMVRKHHGWKTFEKPYSIYGEDIFGVHSIRYAPVAEEDTFMMFGVEEEGIFKSWDDVKEIARELDIKMVPTVFDGVFENVNEITHFFYDNMPNPDEKRNGTASAIGGEACEGFVIRIADEFFVQDFGLHLSKYVRAYHVQTDQHWKKNWQTAELKKTT